MAAKCWSPDNVFFATSFNDTCAAPILVSGSTAKPLPQGATGATGVWSSAGLPALKVARAGAAVTSIADL